LAYHREGITAAKVQPSPLLLLVVGCCCCCWALIWGPVLLLLLLLLQGCKLGILAVEAAVFACQVLCQEAVGVKGPATGPAAQLACSRVWFGFVGLCK
jgi:hypothetical protein